METVIDVCHVPLPTAKGKFKVMLSVVMVAADERITLAGEYEDVASDKGNIGEL